MLIDTHAHPQHRFYGDEPTLPLSAYLAQAAAAGVGQVLGVACRREEWAPMLAAAAQSGCRILLSEDMQHGFTWRGMTIRNPFHDAPP